MKKSTKTMIWLLVIGVACILMAFILMNVLGYYKTQTSLDFWIKNGELGNSDGLKVAYQHFHNSFTFKMLLYGRLAFVWTGIILAVSGYLMFWGWLGEKVAKKKNISDGYLIGFFLHIIGLVVLAFMKDQTLKKVKELDELKEHELITDEEYKERKNKLKK